MAFYVVDIPRPLSFEDSIATEMICPRCRSVLHPPIYHCALGHSLCFRCHSYCRVCPLCGARKEGGRSHHLERIFDVLTFPCTYKEVGCTKRFSGYKIQEHDFECLNFKICCPLRYGTDCTFSGTIPQIVFHSKLVHPRNIFVAEEDLKMMTTNQFNKMLASKRDRKFYYLFHINETLFRAIWSINPLSNQSVLEMNRIAPMSERDQDYGFCIVFKNNDESKRTFSGKCSFLAEDISGCFEVGNPVSKNINCLKKIFLSKRIVDFVVNVDKIKM